MPTTGLGVEDHGPPPSSPGFLILVVILAGASYQGLRQKVSSAVAVIQSTHYSVQISGGMPKAQSSGVPTVLTFTVRNTGSTIPDYVVQFVGLEQWIMDDVSAGSDAGIIAVGPNPGYAFGPLAAGASMTIQLDLAPRNVGNPTLSMTSYADVAAGIPQVGATPIAGGGAVWSTVVKL